MPHLSHSDYARLLDFIAELQVPVSGAEFGASLTLLVGNLVPEAIVAVDQIHETSGTYLMDHNCPIDASDMERYIGRLQQVYQQNPIYDYMQRGGKGPIVRLSDLCSRRELERTDFHQDIFRPLGLGHQLSVIMPRAGWITTLTLSSERDLPRECADLLLLASRHMILAHQTSQAFGELLLPPKVMECLTSREREVFRWMREGKRNGEIAVILGLSVRTIEKHVENILRKTASETRGAAVRLLNPP